MCIYIRSVKFLNFLYIQNIYCLFKMLCCKLDLFLYNWGNSLPFTPPEISLHPVIASLPEFSALPVLDTNPKYCKHPEFS